MSGRGVVCDSLLGDARTPMPSLTQYLILGRPPWREILWSVIISSYTSFDLLQCTRSGMTIWQWQIGVPWFSVVTIGELRWLTLTSTCARFCCIVYWNNVIPASSSSVVKVWAPPQNQIISVCHHTVLLMSPLNRSVTQLLCKESGNLDTEWYW
jgi:hypothetical protein